MDRRNFIKTASAITAGVPLASFEGNLVKNPATEEKIIYRILGKTGLKVPVISMGVVYTDPGVLKSAWKNGVRHFDTAHVYSGGRSEEMLGEFLKQFPRDSYVIATKVKGDGVSGGALPDFTKSSVNDFTEKFNISLKRLQLDYVDIFYYHEVLTKKGILFEPYMKAMEQFKTAGKTRFLGVSAHGNEPEVLRTMIASKFYDVALISINYQQDHYPEVKLAVKDATDAGLGIVAMKTMAGGYADKERNIPVDAKAALKFVLQDENVHTAILGYTTYAQVETATSVMSDLSFRDEDLKKLNWLRSQGSIYCNGCSKCIRQCLKKLPIPDLMRAYMYAYGYTEMYKAANLLREINITKNPCEDCGRCDVICSKNFRIKDKISDIARLNYIPNEFLI
jgi:predicted aldo/keto reductase-like oxidoreductase